MPRQPRLNLPGYFSHVMARGIERRKVFRQSGDYVDFLKRLGENLARSGCRCFAWALMPNHIHLLILTGIRGLTALMQPLLTGHAVRFNIKYRRVGHLFQNRYKSILCQEEPYFKQLVRYIALNPVRAGLVNRPDGLRNYPWTSHSTILGRFERPWFETDGVLSQFGSTRSSGREAYEQFVIDGWNQGYQEHLENGGRLDMWNDADQDEPLLDAEDAGPSDVRVLGDGTFIEGILQQAEIEERQNHLVRQRWSKEELQRMIAERMGLNAEALLSTKRNRPISEARALLIHAAVDRLGLSGVKVSQWLQLSEASISKARVRGQALAERTQFLKTLLS